jgi:hypothetical protein
MRLLHRSYSSEDGLLPSRYSTGNKSLIRSFNKSEGGEQFPVVRAATPRDATPSLQADRAEAFSRCTMLAMRKLMQVVGDSVLQPVCPSCGKTLRLSRITPGTHNLPDQHTYRCQPCGVWVTEAADSVGEAKKPNVLFESRSLPPESVSCQDNAVSRAPTASRMPGTKRCYSCYGPFGLIRHRFAFKQFCSNQCLDQYKSNIEGPASRFKQCDTAFRSIYRRT